MDNEVQKYCLGFVFSKDMSKVILIKKNRPHNLEGMFNGVGGKVEPGENHFQAMKRESIEEIGYHSDDWSAFACLTSQWYKIYCFYTVEKTIPIDECYCSLTDELASVQDVNTLLAHDSDEELVEHVRWLVRMAISIRNYQVDTTYYEVSIP